ncbi:2Fe-2S iron-sulfur cluster binding domain containing protein, putative [Trypanosoma cruzi]|nr:2Fe-2S iron-sulfur cluster binding domain containing protein, putative [Trypanosoma cruzi]
MEGKVIRNRADLSISLLFSLSLCVFGAHSIIFPLQGEGGGVFVQMASEEPLNEIPGECPTPGDLGHAGWDVLHTAGAVYPYKPSPLQQEAFRSFLYSWSHVYACSHCSYHMRRYLKRNPPVVTDKLALNRYLCEFHNTVNKNLAKPVYNCDPMVVLRRWHPTFPDMEDQPTIEEQIAEQRRLEQAEAQKQKEKELQQKQVQTSSLGDMKASRERLVGRWRSEKSESHEYANNNPSSVGAFATGWSASSRQHENAGDAAAKSAPAPLAESREKRWWIFGKNGSGDKNAGFSSTAGTPSKVNSSGGGGNSGGMNGSVDDDEASVMAVLKRLKACMVYCPDKDEKSNSA